MESQVIKRLWKLKLALLALACFLAWMGWEAASESPELKQLKIISMSELTAGAPQPHQYLQLQDSEYLGYYVESIHKSKKNGTTVTLYFAVGTPEQLAGINELKKLSYWVKLPNQFSSTVDAEAFAKESKNLPKPPFTGTWEVLNESSANAGSINGKDASGAYFLNVGNTPTSYGSAYGMLAVAAALCLSLAAWLASDLYALKRAKPLMQPQARVFLGCSSRFLWAIAALATMQLSLYFFIQTAWDEHDISPILALILVLTLIALLYSLSTKDVLLKLDHTKLEVYRRKLQRSINIPELRELYLLNYNRVSKTHEDLRLKGKMPQALQLGSTPWHGGFPADSNLVGALREVMWQHLKPAYQQAFEQGRKLPFGSLALSSEGMLKVNQTQALAFDQIEKIQIAADKLSIHQRGKLLAWHKLKISSIPNPDLLLAFLKQKNVNIVFKQKELATFWHY